MKQYGKTLCPRNPIAQAMRTRRGAGVHQKNQKTQRQADKQALTRALRQPLEPV